VESFVPVESQEGVYDTFARLRDVTSIMLLQTDGAQAGDFAVYQLFRAPAERSLFDLFERCRDEPTEPGAPLAFAAPGTLGHTARYSGVRTDGELLVFDDTLGGAVPADYVHLCGVHSASPQAVSYLAFTAQTGDGPGWSTPWWGPQQPGTLWSFASAPYDTKASSHLGAGVMDGLAGWKSVDKDDAELHAGTYEIYVR
jgi:hypothetical protein